MCGRGCDCGSEGLSARGAAVRDLDKPCHLLLLVRIPFLPRSLQLRLPFQMDVTDPVVRPVGRVLLDLRDQLHEAYVRGARALLQLLLGGKELRVEAPELLAFGHDRLPRRVMVRVE